MDPKEILNLIIDHVRNIWRFRWVGVWVAWGVLILGIFFVHSLPNKYAASAQVYVDTENVLKPLLKGMYVETNVMNDVTIMTRALVTRPHLEKVIRETDLDLRVESESDNEILINSLESRINISRSRENIYTIEFTDESRDISLSIVEALLNTFVEDTLGTNARDSDSAEETIKVQLAQYEKRLTISEEKLKRFKQDNIGLMPGQGGGYYAQLEASVDKQEKTELDLGIAKEKQATIQRQLDGSAPLFSEAGSSYDQQIQDLAQLRNNLLLEFTEQHPEVRRAGELLRRLNEKREAELQSSGSGLSLNFDANKLNPVYQNLQIQMSAVQVEIASLRTQLKNDTEELVRLRNLVDIIPEVEAQLTRLNRDYAVIQDRYQDLLGRWESLQTGRLVNSGRDQVTFRVIEPPFASRNPVSPDRNLLVGVVLMAALGSGGAMALLFGLLSPVFTSEHSLMTVGPKIIGQVTYQFSTGKNYLQRWRYAAVGVSLAALFATAVAAIVYGNVLSSTMQQIVSL